MVAGFSADFVRTLDPAFEGMAKNAGESWLAVMRESEKIFADVAAKFKEQWTDKISPIFQDLANQRRREDPYRDRHIHVHAHINAEQVSITIHDDGPGFDHSQLPDPTDPEYLDRPHGRGLLLMRTFADTVRFNDVGNEVTLVKRTE
jgi:hypothetical protein